MIGGIRKIKGRVVSHNSVTVITVVVFQKKVDETFSDITGVTGISDDIIVVGYKSDGSDQDANLTAVLERARATALYFNDKKMVVRCKRIPFIGNIIGADGFEPDLEKVTAIGNMRAPTDVKELQTFLGMANYLGRFTPQLATVQCQCHSEICARRTFPTTGDQNTMQHFQT